MAGVVGAVEPALSIAEQQRAARKSPNRLNALESYYRGLWHLNRSTAEDYDAARGFFVRATELDANYAPPHGGIALVHCMNAISFRRSGRASLAPVAAAQARRAVALDPLCLVGHIALAVTELLLGRHDESLGGAETALRLSPNSAWSHVTLGMVFTYSGRPREAIAPLCRAMRLSPLDLEMWIILMYFADAHYFARDYRSAATAARELLRLRPDLRRGHGILIAALAQDGRVDELDAAMCAAHGEFGNVQIATALDGQSELRKDDRLHILDGLQKAAMSV